MKGLVAIFLVLCCVGLRADTQLFYVIGGTPTIGAVRLLVSCLMSDCGII